LHNSSKEELHFDVEGEYNVVPRESIELISVFRAVLYRIERVQRFVKIITNRKVQQLINKKGFSSFTELIRNDKIHP
jgi:hypothetical protein